MSLPREIIEKRRSDLVDASHVGKPVKRAGALRIRYERAL
jgi:hypothetical protein